jgi:hypothetical protein
VVLGSRAELAASLTADAQAVRETESVLAEVEATVDDAASEAAWAAAKGLGVLAGDELRGASDVARLARAAADVRSRDVAWALMTRANAQEHLGLWREVLRRCPERLVPGVAALTAFAAWLAGHGALAWCAVDRCVALDPGHRLASQIARLLDLAVPPSAWDETRAVGPLVS